MFEEMVISKIGIMNWWLQQKIGFTNFSQIFKISTNPILDQYISSLGPIVKLQVSTGCLVHASYSTDYRVVHL